MQHMEYTQPILHTLHAFIRYRIYPAHNSTAYSIIIYTTDSYNVCKTHRTLTSYTQKTYSRHTYRTHNILIGVQARYTEHLLWKQHTIDTFTIHTRTRHTTYTLTQCIKSTHHKCDTHTVKLIHTTHISKPIYENAFTLNTTGVARWVLRLFG